MPNIIKTPEEMRRQTAAHTTPETLRLQKAANFHVWWVASMVALAIVIFIIASFRWSQEPPIPEGYYDPIKPGAADSSFLQSQSERFDIAYKSIPRNPVTNSYSSALERCVLNKGKESERITCDKPDVSATFNIEPAASPLQTGDELQQYMVAGGWQAGSYDVTLGTSDRRYDIPRASVTDIKAPLEAIRINLTFSDETGTICADISMYVSNKERWRAEIYDCTYSSSPEGDLL